MPELFHRLSRNVFTIFSGRNLLWHALAILLTIVIVMSGFDWTYFRWTRGDAFVRFARPAIIIGTFLPLTAILILLLVGAITKNRRFITTAWALGQAALLGYLYMMVAYDDAQQPCLYVCVRRCPPHPMTFKLSP